MGSTQISLNPDRITRVLAMIATVIVLVSFGWSLAETLMPHVNIKRYSRFFYIDKERNIPSGFSTLLLLFTFLLLAVITQLKRQAGESILHWAVLLFGFLLMAFDESWALHEKLEKPMRYLIGAQHLGVFYFTWVIPGIAVVVVLALFFMRFLLRLPRKTSLSFITAGAIYIAGCLGVELIDGKIAEVEGFHNLTYIILVHIEESLEMAGVILFIRALIVYIADTYKEVTVQF